jgi:hypothetical protein
LSPPILASYPVTVATLTLPGPDSTGSASWPFGIDVATYTGDSFAFSFDRDGPLRDLPLTQAFIPPPGGCASGFQLCDFNISWTESAGELTALNLQVDGFDDNVDNTRGSLAFLDIASMNGYEPCAAGGSCQVAGSWVSSLVTAPEPGSLALLASAFGVWGLIRQRCTRLIKPRTRARIACRRAAGSLPVRPRRDP